MPTDAVAFLSYSNHKNQCLQILFLSTASTKKQILSLINETLLSAIHLYASSASNNIFNNCFVLIHIGYWKQSIISSNLGLQYCAKSHGLVPLLDMYKHYMQLHQKSKFLTPSAAQPSLNET
jgi:hypothetical protein